ncbi:MAG: hypothetical protein KDD34_01605, partial [Bdellovibrionales bacterium]|nr:hypothetical protein [Bdellovibrionales bacterium]
MEFTVISQDLKVEDVKPEESMQNYTHLVESDMKEFFSSHTSWQERECPACGTKQELSSFKKMDVPYKRCVNCYTVYASKTPTQDEINQFYQKGKSRKYWAENLWQNTEKARIDKVIDPIIDWIDNFTVSKFELQNIQFAEVGSIHSGLLDRWSSLGRKTMAVAPLYSTYIQNNSKIESYSYQEVREFNVLHLPNTLDRSKSPLEILNWCHGHMTSDGLCFLTAILSTGLDSLILDEKLETLVPPDRLNCFSYEGLEELVERAGFEIIEYSTPGELDLDNIRRSLNTLPESGLKTFFNYIFEKRNDQNLLVDFKKFLQMNRLSSR